MRYLQYRFNIGAQSKKYKDNWEETFGKKDTEEKAEEDQPESPSSDE